MKNTSTKSLAILAVVGTMFATQSCNKNNNTNATRGAAIEVQVAVQGADLKASSSKAEASKTTFVDGDSFGMWVVPFSNSEATSETHAALRGIDNYVDNALYTMSAGSWATAAEVFYPNADIKVDLYAVTPYDSKMSNETDNNMADPTKFDFQIKQDQTTASGVDVIASDIMTAKTEGAKQGSTTAPTLTFKHRMSKARITFTLANDTYKGKAISAIKSVEVCGVQLKSTINIVDLAVDPAVQALATNPKVSINAFQASAPAATEPSTIKGDYVYEAIVMPGTLISSGSSVARVTLTVDSQDVIFDCKVSADFTYTASSQTSIAVTIDDQSSITLEATDITITAWGDQTPPTTSTVKPAKMIFNVTDGGETTAETVKYAKLMIDGKEYVADVTYNSTTKKLECLYRMPSSLYPYELTAVEFSTGDNTVITPTTEATLPANIVGKPFEINTYDKVIGTVTF